MEIEIKTDKEVKKLNLRPLYAREVDKGFSLFIQIEKKKEDKERMEALEKYMDYLNELTLEISGLKKEELGNLFSEERDKVVGYCQDKIQAKFDFLKPSLKSESSEQKATSTSSKP